MSDEISAFKKVQHLPLFWSHIYSISWKLYQGIKKGTDHYSGLKKIYSFFSRDGLENASDYLRNVEVDRQNGPSFPDLGLFFKSTCHLLFALDTGVDS